MDKVTAFDALFTNNQIQKMKVLISYVDSPMQRQLAVYIKFLELQYTLELLKRSPQLSVSPTPQEGSLDPAKLCQEITPYCSPKEQSQLNQFASMFQAMSHYQEMMETVKMFQEMFPEGMSFPNAEAADINFGNNEVDSESPGNGNSGDDSPEDGGANGQGDGAANEGNGGSNGRGDGAGGFFGGMNPDMMPAGLGGLFGGNMPDLSQLMSLMNMMQPANQPGETPPPENDP